MLLLTDLIPVHLLYCGQTVMIGCNHTSFEWTRAVRHIYGIIRHMQGLYLFFSPDYILQCICLNCNSMIMVILAGKLMSLYFSVKKSNFHRNSRR